jgi:hypothetical protein
MCWIVLEQSCSKQPRKALPRQQYTALTDEIGAVVAEEKRLLKACAQLSHVISRSQVKIAL